MSNKIALDGSLRWWYLWDFGCYQTEATEDEFNYGGIGPFKTFEETYIGWASETGNFGPIPDFGQINRGRWHDLMLRLRVILLFARAMLLVKRL